MTRIAEALPAAGNTGEAERVACSVLFSNALLAAVGSLLELRSAGLGLRHKDDWLTRELVAEIVGQHHSG